MTATHNCKVTTRTDVLYLAFELGETQWKLAFTIGVGQKPRLRSMPARDLPRLQEEIAKAKKRFQLPQRCTGAELLRSGPGWLLVTPSPGHWRDRQLRCGFGEH